MPELRPVYLLVGADRPKIERALARLVARMGEGAVERLSAREAGGDDAVSACNALGLLAAGGGRLVIVSDVERWKAADVKAVEAYLASPTPGAVLALTGDVKADAALARAVRKRGDVLAYDIAKRNLPGWVRAEFRRVGARADLDAARALVELVGEDVQELATEVDKLATWAAGEPITPADVEALVPPRSDTSVFALTDAWGRRDLPGVLTAAEELLERSERPRRDEVTRVLSLLVGHVGRVRRCRALAAAGTRPRDAAATLKMHPFAAEKAFAHAASYSEDELRDVVVRLAELDVAAKGGSRLPGDVELERALVEVTGGDRP